MPSSGSRSTQIRASRHCSPPVPGGHANRVSDRARGLSGGFAALPRGRRPSLVRARRDPGATFRSIGDARHRHVRPTLRQRTDVRLWRKRSDDGRGVQARTQTKTRSCTSSLARTTARDWQVFQRRCRRKPSRLSAAGQVCNDCFPCASVQRKWPCGRRGLTEEFGPIATCKARRFKREDLSNRRRPSRRRAKLAEREGFEPSVEFPLHTLSKRAPSTTRTSLRLFRISSLQASG